MAERFSIPLNVPGLPDSTPVYDVVLTRGDTRLAAVSPYYARPAWTGLEICVDGETVQHWVEDDPNHFCAIAYADLPGGKRGSVSVEITSGGLAVWIGRVDPVDGPSGHICLATLAKFDWPWIDEWIEHHRALGVGHFYVYNNGEPRLSERLNAHPDVTEIAWLGPYRLYNAERDPYWPPDCHWYLQPAQQMHAALKYGDQWTWIGLFDPDEFLVCGKGENLHTLLAPTRWKADVPLARLGALRIQGKWFGNAGHHSRPEGSIRQNYLRCERGHTSATKCFVRPSAVRHSRIHWCSVEGETIHVDPLLLRFNHYRGISDHNVRRSARFDREFTNECENREILTWV